MRFKLASHPESSRRLIHHSLTLYRESFRHVFVFSLLLSLVTFLPRLISLLMGEDLFANLPIFSVHRLWMLGLNFLGLIIFIAILWRMYCLIEHKRDSLQKDLIKGIKKFPAVFIASLVQSLLMAIITVLFAFFIYYIVLDQHLNLLQFSWGIKTISVILLFLLLAITLFIFLSFYFYLPLIVLEDTSILKSLTKSSYLVWKNLWRTIYVQATPWFIYLLTLILIKFVLRLNIHIYFLADTDQTLVGTLIQIIVFAIFIPWIATMLIMQLHDLELRHLPSVKGSSTKLA